MFLCVLALQIDRWMRKSLRSVLAQNAVDLLRRIKAVTVTSLGGSSRVDDGRHGGAEGSA